jgi:pimeloyl-ACP methyl ester carboxylesterase
MKRVTLKYNKGYDDAFIVPENLQIGLNSEGNINLANGKHIPYLFSKVENAMGHIVAVGGTGGGFYGPANIYNYLATILPKHNINILRLDVPKKLDEAAEAVVEGVKTLYKYDKKPIILMGWSRGGASVIKAALNINNSSNSIPIKGLILLASQSAGTEGIEKLKGIPLLLIHGTADLGVDYRASLQIMSEAQDPKELVTLKGGSHWMHEGFGLMYFSIVRKIDEIFRTSVTLDFKSFNDLSIK